MPGNSPPSLSYFCYRKLTLTERDRNVILNRIARKPVMLSRLCHHRVIVRTCAARKLAAMLRNSPLVQRAVAFEISLCLAVSRRCQRQLVQRVFSIISRLGDGLFWYVLMITLPVIYGPQAVLVSGQMAGAGLFSQIVYKSLKSSTSRKRPCDMERGIRAGTPPLDLYSFPSGHTLHAVSFSVVATHHFPGLAVVLIPMCALIAASRIILGLHYPTDVVAGIVLGSLVATSWLWAFG